MPIGDLLASISGEKPPAAVAPAPPKRKAEDSLRPAPKIARRDPPTQSSRPADQRSSTTRPMNGNAAHKSTPVSKTPSRPSINTNGTHMATKPATPGVRPSPSAHTPAAPSSPSVNKVPPKKGSYAEVLARAKKAQEAMGQVGKIQHKKVDRKERVPVTKPEPRAMSGKSAATPSSKYRGTAKSGQRVGMNGSGSNGSAGDPRGKTPIRPGAAGRESKDTQEEGGKRFKKAAEATTGYAGTSRPPPTSKSRRDAPRGGALLNRQIPRPGASRSSRYEEDYDEELDDFIEYDDEDDEGPGGPRHYYDSDGSSDMEVGMDELAGEERMAEQIARREDVEEERLERSLKAAKEERKRKALEALRAKKH